MILTTWCEVYDGERMALWIKVLERPAEDAKAELVVKYSRQIELPASGVSTEGQMSLLASELMELVRLIDSGAEVRRYIGRPVGWTETMLGTSSSAAVDLGTARKARTATKSRTSTPVQQVIPGT